MDESARSAPNQKTPLPPDSELVELLWQNGGVVAQAQTHQRSFGRGQSGGNPGTSGITGEETTVWFPDGDPLDRDLYSRLCHSIANVDRHGGRNAGALARPPAWSGAGSSRAGEVGSSFCGSNMVTAPALRADDDFDDAVPPEEEPDERAGASSSGGSGSNALFKRGRDELDSRSEDADCEAVDETRPSRWPVGKHRTRAAEVHNLSERRRRDRINEKMRALQELVPHCNKNDKASILAEAIDYVKSLQLQVQIMWITTRMAPMMFPGAHQLMSPMAMGLNSGCMPAAQGLSQLLKVPPYTNNPLQNQMPQIPSPAINAPNVANQMQNYGICEPRNPFLHPIDTLTAATQVPGLFPYGSQMEQQNEIHELLGSTAILRELLGSTAIPASGAQPPSSSDGTGT